MYLYVVFELWGYVGTPVSYTSYSVLYFRPPVLQGTIFQGALYSTILAILAPETYLAISFFPDDYLK